MASFNPFLMLGTYLIVLISCSFVNSEEDSCRTLDAAFHFDSKLYLVSGENYYAIGHDMSEEESGSMSDLFSGTDGQMDAAVVWSGDDTLYFFYGSRYHYYSTWFSKTYGPYRNSRWTPFFLEGIDAAGRLADRTYFFKGCDYLVYDGAYSEPRRVHDIGLPCDVDAAWDQGDFMVVAKGGQSWTLDASGRTRGPVTISTEITLHSISLCESEAKASWANRNKKELEYEKQNECVIIDSAVSYDGTVYLFNDDSYVRLDASGKEDLFGRNYDWGGLGKGVDGAIHLPAKNKAYFFQGDEYFTYYGLAFGPFSASSDWAPFFAEGISAAGRHRELSYFFQGCHVASYDVETNAVLEIYNSDDLGLPCNVSAAYTKDDTLYVIKGDDVWIWGDDVTGPGPLSEVMSLTSWTICSS